MYLDVKLIKLFFMKEKYSNLFLYIKKYFLKLCGRIDGCVCWGGGL